MLSPLAQALYHVGCSLRHLWKAVCALCEPGLVFLAIGTAALAFLLFGCTRKESAPISSFKAVAVDTYAWRGDSSYAAANPEWLAQFYESEFRPFLSKTLVNWDQRFDCNKFAALFASMAQVAYLRDSWHQTNAPQSLAVGEAWVSRKTGNHALVCFYTEQGEFFLEPQTGKLVEAGGPIYFRRL